MKFSSILALCGVLFLSSTVLAIDCNACDYNCGKKLLEFDVSCFHKKGACKASVNAFNAIVSPIIASCAQYSKRMDKRDLIDKAKGLLVLHGFFDMHEFDGVQIRWCPYINKFDKNVAGMAPAIDKIFLHQDYMLKPIGELAALLGHEMVHIRQHRRGTNRFKCEYSKDVVLLKDSIALENEAYACEARIENKLKSKWLNEEKQTGQIRIKDGRHFINYCADYNPGSSNLYMHPCHGGENQVFTLQKEGTLTVNSDKSKCVDYDKKHNVYLHPCHEEANQKWIYQNGRLKSLYDPSKCLDMDATSKNLYMHKCHQGWNQFFRFTKKQGFTKSYIQIKKNTGYANYCADYKLDGSGNLYMFPCHKGLNQLFSLQADGLMKVEYDKGKCLDYDMKSNVYLHPCHGGSNQRWVFTEDGRIKNVYDPSKCLDLNPGNANLYMHNCHQGWNQLFRVVTPRHGFTARRIQIKNNAGYANYCADYKLDGSNNFYMFPCHAGKNQVFTFEPNGLVKVEYDKSKCLDYDKKRNVYFSTCHGGTNQRWIISGDGRIRNEQNPSKCLDLNPGNKNLYMHNCHQGWNQFFKIV